MELTNEQKQKSLNDLKEFTSTATYGIRKYILFQIVPQVIRTAVDIIGYTTDKPLDYLLKNMTYSELFCYIYKDSYLREYVFDADDQRKAINKCFDNALNIVLTEDLREQYIANHDDFVKNEDAKMQTNIAAFIPQEA